MALIHLFLMPFRIGFAQFGLEDLAGAGEGQVVAFKGHAAAALLVGYPFAAMGDDTGLIKFLTFRPAGNSMHLFSPFFMQEADHRAFDHGIVLIDGILDLRRINVLTARDNHVFDSVDNVDKTVVVHISVIACMQPTVAQGLGGQFRQVSDVSSPGTY